MNLDEIEERVKKATTKKCNKCGLVLNITCFYKIGAVCKTCYSINGSIYRSKNRENKRRRDREYRELHSEEINNHMKLYKKAHPEMYKRRIEAWRSNNPEKRRAHERVSYQLRAGKLSRPSLCPICKVRTDIVAHHEDYSKPLDVAWMCQRCHRYLHLSRYRMEVA